MNEQDKQSQDLHTNQETTDNTQQQKMPTPEGAQKTNIDTQKPPLGAIGGVGVTIITLTVISFVGAFWASLYSLIESLTPQQPTYLDYVVGRASTSELNIMYDISMILLNAAIVASLLITIRAIALRKHNLIVGQGQTALYIFAGLFTTSFLITTIKIGSSALILTGPTMTVAVIAAISFAQYLAKSDMIKRYANK